VGTLAINGAQNAALLAVQILATADPERMQQVLSYKQALVEKVEAMDARVSGYTRGES
jgi:5-(carboxyamino)imidazole ribonucleotide mutase